MKHPASASLRVSTLAATAAVLFSPLHAADWIGAVDGAFSNGDNWSGGVAPSTGDALVFGAAGATTALVSDQTDFSYSSLTFTADAPAYTLTGLIFSLGTGGIVNRSGVLQTIDASFSGRGPRPLITSAGGGDLLVTGNITGSGRLAKSGYGTLTLAGTHTLTGGLSLGSVSMGNIGSGSGILTGGSGTGGVVRLDFAAAASPTSNILFNGQTPGALNAYSGLLRVVGADGEANSQAFGNTIVRGGHATIRLEAGAGGTIALNLGTFGRSGTANEARLGMFDLELPAGAQTATNGITTTSTTLTNGIFASGGAFATVGGSTWATLSGTNIVGLDTGSYVANTDTVIGTSTQNVNVVTDTTLAASASVYTLRFATADTGGLTNTVNVGAGNLLTVAGGGILVTDTVGAGDVTISGGGLTGASGRSLSLFQYNTGGALRIGSVISNNGTIMAVNVGGGGEVELSGANTYSGFTMVSGGSTLSISSNANLGAPATASTLGIDDATLRATATFTLDNGGANARNVGLAGDGIIEVTDAHVLTIPGVVGGDGSLVKSGSGTLLLAGANTFVGATRVDAGTLELASTGTLASQSLRIANGAIFDVSAKAAYALVGTTMIEIGSDGAGLFDAGATTSLTLGDDLVLHLAATDFGAGATFDLFDFNAASGAFASITLAGSFAGSLVASLDEAGLWSGTFGGHAFVFDAGSGVLDIASAIPEPASCAALLGAFALGATTLRRRRSPRA